MSKIYEPTTEVVKEVNDIVSLLGLSEGITFKVLFKDDMKVFATVAKGNAAVEYLANAEPIVIVYVNESMYDAFDYHTRRMLFENELMNISFDYDKGKMRITKPEIQLNSQCWVQYGQQLLDAYMAMLLSKESAEQTEEEL